MTPRKILGCLGPVAESEKSDVLLLNTLSEIEILDIKQRKLRLRLFVFCS